ncbi:MAG TPA: hypothetical protein VJS86_03265 [Arthrobacter sp.]|nr:hypothetical protein [Arthrobacter sp.]
MDVSAVPASARVLHSRAVSAVTAASCIVHLWLVAGNHHGPWLGAVMLAMVGVCLPCAVHLWRGAGERSLRQVMGCALAMTALHAVLLLGAPGTGGGPLGHAHAGAARSAAAAAGAGAAADAAGLMAIIVLEITTAFLAATLLARLRADPRTAPVAAR